jgi:hypothetical protein
VFAAERRAGRHDCNPTTRMLTAPTPPGNPDSPQPADRDGLHGLAAAAAARDGAAGI